MRVRMYVNMYTVYCTLQRYRNLSIQLCTCEHNSYVCTYIHTYVHMYKRKY